MPLNATGQAQARGCGRRLADGSWDTVVSSPLSRASETADIIADELDLAVSARLAELRERHYGAAEGMTEYDAYDHFGGWFPELEPRREVAERALRAIGKLCAEYPDASIVVVTHGGVIRALLDTLLARGRSPRIRNGGISTVTIDDRGATVHSIDGIDLR